MNPAKALRYLIMDPVEHRSLAMMCLRAAQLLHERGGGRYDATVRWLGSLLKPKLRLPASQRMNEEAIAGSVAALRQKGWDILPWRLGAVELAELRRFAFLTPAYVDDPRERIMLDERNIPRDHGRYMWRMSDLIRVPAIQRLIAESSLHRLAQSYLDCRPTLTSITLWLDPVYEGTYEAHVYHYDNDGPAFLKVFIYVTDVDLESGAHTFIQSSHDHRKPEQFRLSRRYHRDDLLKHYGAKNEIAFCAPAGTILVEDTAGFHKGTTLKKGFRLLLQLQYAVLDIPHAEEFSPAVERVQIEGLHPGIRKIGRKFFK